MMKYVVFVAVSVRAKDGIVEGEGFVGGGAVIFSVCRSLEYMSARTDGKGQSQNKALTLQ